MISLLNIRMYVIVQQLLDEWYDCKNDEKKDTRKGGQRRAVVDPAILGATFIISFSNGLDLIYNGGTLLLSLMGLIAFYGM